MRDVAKLGGIGAGCRDEHGFDVQRFYEFAKILELAMRVGVGSRGVDNAGPSAALRLKIGKIGFEFEKKEPAAKTAAKKSAAATAEAAGAEDASNDAAEEGAKPARKTAAAKAAPARKTAPRKTPARKTGS